MLCRLDTVLVKRFCTAPSAERCVSICEIASARAWTVRWESAAVRMLRSDTVVSTVAAFVVSVVPAFGFRPKASRPVPALPSLIVMSLLENNFKVPSVFLLAVTPVLALLIDETMVSAVSPFLNLTSTPLSSIEVSAVSLAWEVPAARPNCASEPPSVLASLTSLPSLEVSSTRPSALIEADLMPSTAFILFNT